MSRNTSRVGGALVRTAAFSTRAIAPTAKVSTRRRALILHTTARRGHANLKPGCSTCLYRHECFPAHFTLPPIPAPAEAAVRGFWANPSVRRLLPSTLLAVSAMGTGLLIWNEHERLAALSERYLGQDVFNLFNAEAAATIAGGEHDRQRVWDQLSTRPEILNSFLFCSCGCGEKVDFHSGQFEMKSGRVFTRSHFRCDGCGKQLQGTTASGAADHHQHAQQEDGWVFDRDGKLYCVYDFMDKFCHTCSGCGHELGDQLAVDPRLGAAFCVDCFEHSSPNSGQSVEQHFKIIERVESQSQADKLMREVKQWLSQEMGLEFAGADGDIPLSLYRSEKIEQLKGTNSKKEGTDEMGSTLGLTVKQASRRSIFSKKTYTPKEVILVKGLSVDHAGAVLAHEMMHCWIALYLSQTSQLPEEVEEGLCELMSYFWLVQKQNQTATTTAQPPAEKRSEVGYLLGRMERNWDNAQGRGFHRALNSLQAQEDGNLRMLLSHARQHADFPTALPSL